jgi:hypothetical protein
MTKSQKLFKHMHSNECELLRDVLDMLDASEDEERAAVTLRMAALRQDKEYTLDTRQTDRDVTGSAERSKGSLQDANLPVYGAAAK